jgi:hypothetical protein
VSPTLAWHERPRDEANLFNPAFLGLLLERTAYGHQERAGKGLPWTLGYVALPAILHRETREALPTGVATSMPAWTRDNAVLVASLAQRAIVLRPLLTEAMLFGLAHGIVVHENGLVFPARHARRRLRDPWHEPTEDFRSCATKAAFFGRWCGVSGQPATIYALWGVRP